MHLFVPEPQISTSCAVQDTTICIRDYLHLSGTKYYGELWNFNVSTFLATYGTIADPLKYARGSIRKARLAMNF